MKTSYRCWAEVDLSALRENLGWLRDQVGPGVKILTVVKADAYGHGLKQIAALLMQSGTDIFGVANLAEARSIRSVGKGWPILMLGACLPDEVDAAVRDEIRPTISTRGEAERFSAAAVRLHKQVWPHLKIDTGMGRLGAEPESALELVRQIRRLDGLSLEGIYTHYSSAEEDVEYSRSQADRFSGLLSELRTAGIEIPLIHANNSGALLFEPRTVFNLVRPGLLVYGVVPPCQRPVQSQLRSRVRPALAFKSRVSLVKEVAPGRGLSYGHTYITPHRLRLATVTAGYGDGYLRAASNRGQVLVCGQRCPILGRITMDQMLVDVSTVEKVDAGDEVVLLGTQQGATITANEVAHWMNTIPWEVFTNITYRVPRLYHGSQAA